MHFVENSNVFSDSSPQGSTNETFQYLFNKYSRRQSDPNPGWRNLELVTIGWGNDATLKIIDLIRILTSWRMTGTYLYRSYKCMSSGCQVCVACSGFYYIDGRGCIPKFTLQPVALQPPPPLPTLSVVYCYT